MKRHIYNYLLFAILISPVSLWADNYVIINQVMYDSPLNEYMNKPHACNGEFVELYNAGTSDVSLANWVLKGDGTNEEFVFTQGTILPAGKYLVLACKRGADNTFQLGDLYNPMPESMNYSVWYQNNITLSNDGETLTLCNAQHDTVDWIYYEGESHLSKPYRLEAANADSTPGNLCVSLHRTWAEFDAEGKAVPGTSQWNKDYVTFAVGYLPDTAYSEISLTGEQAMQTGDNYVLSITPLDPVTRMDMNGGRPSMSSGIRVRTTLQYMDGLGRVNESIALGITPGKNDLVAVTDYHDKSHAARRWLPVVMNTDGERMAIAAVRDQVQTDYGDDYPYTETEYENSALRRQTKQIRPGESFRNYGAEQTYDLNSAADQVRLYTVGADSVLQTDGTCYAEATLYKNTIKDEDGKTLITYTDRQGRKIMEKRDNNCTYYVYDELERLCFVLPALPGSELNNGSYPLNNPYLKAASYCYWYDSKGNMTYKRLPGCEAQHMVYDKYGQLVLKQDGNQRPAGKWTMCAYDSVGRNLYTAEIALEQTHAELMAFFADKWQVEHYGHNSSFPLTGTGYASRLLKNKNIRLLTVNYYDNYDFLDILPTPVRQKLRFSEESGYVPKYDNSTGLLTGTRIYNLSEDGYTSTVYYYDIGGRVIQNRSVEDSIRYVAVGTEYLFDGSMAQQKTERHMADNIVTEHYRCTYDHAGRGKKVYYQLNNDEEITLSSFSYDSIGRLVQNLLHDNQDTIRYSYDMRNMLTATKNKHFSEDLFYADSVSAFAHATPCHNGNIAVARTLHADTSFTFIYSYDQQNRLVESEQDAGDHTKPSEWFRYDDRGNIRQLQRYSGDRLIDDLHFSYQEDGNQLLSITDDGEDADLYSTIEYHNAAAQTDTAMYYDANGNLIKDKDRGIVAIHYNILNLPDTVQFVNGNQIVNLYDAAGKKYKSIIYSNLATVITPCYEMAHYTFETDSIEYHVTEYNGNVETYYTPRDTALRIFNAIGYYTDSTYYHYIKDHLGNICAVVNANTDTVVQRTMYYASGVPMAQSWGREAQPYLYNGKEFIEAHGWNTYDYGFRGYYAPTGRFTSIDPLAESTPWQSPYAYANNNFINAVDWMGLDAITVSGQAAQDFFKYLIKGGDWRNYDYSGWDDVTDMWEHDFFEEFGYSYFLYTAIAGPGGGDGWGGTIANVTMIRSNIKIEKFVELCKAVGDFAAKGVEAGSFGTNAWIADQWNPFYWIGAKGQIYTREFLHKRGGYANSFKKAGERLVKSNVGKIGTGLSGVSVAIAAGDMWFNGVSVRSGIDLGVASVGLVAGTVLAGTMVGVELILFCTIYGFADIGVTCLTGNSISGWIDYGVHQGINYFTEGY